MNDEAIDKIAQAVLYEGYMLYPYRRCTKNTQRWTFGCLFPQTYSGAVRGFEPAFMQTQCLLRGNAQTTLRIRVKFLQPVDRTIGKMIDNHLDPVDEIELNGKRYQSWQEAIERTAVIQASQAKTVQSNFEFPAQRTVESIDENVVIERTQQRIQGSIEIRCDELRPGIFRITTRVTNCTPLADAAMPRDEAQRYAFASTHLILTTENGAFISAIDPPSDLADLATRCRQTGAWPVLVGEPGQTNAMLAAPIILYDYPQIAVESAGDLFDGTEIDEILSLRVMTLSDDEKQQIQSLDPRSAEMLRRTESLARNELMRLHGTMRTPRKVEAIHVGNAELRAGDHVRLKPTGRADAFDILLRGKTATIVAIEQDYESRLHLAVTIDDDPGADIGAAGKIGHRFFFRPDEVEPVKIEPVKIDPVEIEPLQPAMEAATS